MSPDAAYQAWKVDIDSGQASVLIADRHHGPYVITRWSAARWGSAPEWPVHQ